MGAVLWNMLRRSNTNKLPRDSGVQVFWADFQIIRSFRPRFRVRGSAEPKWQICEKHLQIRTPNTSRKGSSVSRPEPAKVYGLRFIRTTATISSQVVAGTVSQSHTPAEARGAAGTCYDDVDASGLRRGSIFVPGIFFESF